MYRKFSDLKIEVLVEDTQHGGYRVAFKEEPINIFLAHLNSEKFRSDFESELEIKIDSINLSDIKVNIDIDKESSNSGDFVKFEIILDGESFEFYIAIERFLYMEEESKTKATDKDISDYSYKEDFEYMSGLYGNKSEAMNDMSVRVFKVSTK